jgi:hypothetical protein
MCGNVINGNISVSVKDRKTFQYSMIAVTEDQLLIFAIPGASLRSLSALRGERGGVRWVSRNKP